MPEKIITRPHSETIVNIFDAPSGNVRGLANLTVSIGGKAKVVAKVTLLVAEAAEISVKLPYKVDSGSLCRVGEELAAFAAYIDTIDTGRHAK